MTPEKLQKELIKELEPLFSQTEFRDENGEKVKMRFFAQTLPRKESEDDPEPFPWCVVKLGRNDVKDVGGLLNQIQQVSLIFGIYYDEKDCQYQHMMFTLFEKVKKRFLEKPILAGAFSALPEMVSMIDDEEEETYPYYFGGMSLQFLLQTYEREDEYF